MSGLNRKDTLNTISACLIKNEFVQGLKHFWHVFKYLKCDYDIEKCTKNSLDN